MTRLTIIFMVIAGLFAFRAPAQQITTPLPVAVISCGLRTKPPGLFGRLLHRKRKSAPVIGVYHASDFRLLVPEEADRWKQSEARRLGLRVPSRFCSEVLPSSEAMSLAEAAARAAVK